MRSKKYNTKGLRIWNEDIAEAVKEKKQAYLKLMDSPNDQDRKIDYKRKSAIVKRKVRQIKRNSWEKYVSELEHTSKEDKIEHTKS